MGRYNTKIEIDQGMCNSCKMCVGACFVDVIRWDDKEERPIVAYPEDCVWCLACEEACPVQCIEVIPTIPGHLPEWY
jgi:NAD-dependent dihydropyrimidine dehydrogenase PreA subunit